MDQKSYDILRRIYEATTYLRQAEKEKLHPALLRMLRQALERLWSKARRHGIDEEMLSEAAGIIWMDVAGDDVSMSYRDSCLLHFKHVQDVENGNEKDARLACPHADKKECGPFCGHYKEATKRQVERFEAGQDLEG